MTRSITASLFLALASSTALAGNSLYLEQSGTDATINIEQMGDNNIIGTSTTNASVLGSYTILDITQLGMDNELALIIDGMTADVTLLQDGSFNAFNVDIGGYLGSDDVTLSLGVDGDYNTVNVTVGNTASTSNATINMTVTGDYNTTDIIENGTSSSTSAKVTNVDIVGDTNTITVTKSGAGLQLFDLTHTGDSGTFTATQSGAADNSATVSTNGNNANITVLQH